MEGMPWVALPFGVDRFEEIDQCIPWGGYPTPGVIDGATGKVINDDCYDLDQYHIKDFLEWKRHVDGHRDRR